MSQPTPHSIDSLKMAFCWHLARRIMQADTVVEVSEAVWLLDRFPLDALQAAGLADKQGAETEDFSEILGQAMVVLPDALDLSGKFEVLKSLFDATLADADFHHQEGHALIKAGRLLGMSTSEIEQFLEEQTEVGDVELPEPE